MSSLIFFFLLISSGSVFASTRYGKTYEETVPFTIFCGVEILFFFGLIDNLRLGFWTVCLLAAALYILSGIQLWRRKNWKETCGRLFTPAFFIFLALLAAYAFLICGRCAYLNDEFSFWATSVKKMFFNHKFACAVEKYLTYVEYPPGMQLIQYVLQMLRGAFTDWRLSFAYTAYLFSLFLPFLKGLRFRHIPVLVLISAVILSSVSIINPGYLNNLQVDTALGVTFAYGLASLFFLGEGNGRLTPFSFANIVMTANMLFLIKSAGGLFAAALLLALPLAAGCLYGVPSRKLLERGRRRWRKPAAYTAGICIPLVTALLWKAKYSQYVDLRAPDFDAGKYDIPEFIQILFFRMDGGYRGEIRDKFFSFLVTAPKQIACFSPTNLQILLFLTAAFLLVCYAYRTYGSQRVHICAFFVMFFTALVYWLGLLGSYMYTFSQDEGIGLASMQRYLNIYHIGILLCVIFLILRGYVLLQWNLYLFSVALVGLLFFSSGSEMLSLITRSYVRTSCEETRTTQELVSNLPPANGAEDQAVLLVYKQGSPHLPVNRIAYLAYEGYTFPWECSYGSRMMDNDPGYTRIYTAEEFHAHVYELGVSYIALELLDEDFILTYGGLFNAPLENGQVYQVPEKGSSLFELVSPIKKS